MYALEMDEEEVEEHIYGLMGTTPNGNGGRKVAVAAK
jgi:hypothetical protein